MFNIKLNVTISGRVIEGAPAQLMKLLTGCIILLLFYFKLPALNDIMK